MEQSDVETQGLPDLRELLRDLAGELAGGGEDDHGGLSAAGGTLTVLGDATGTELAEAVESGETERKGLAGTGAAATDYVATEHGRLKRLSLDGGEGGNGLPGEDVNDLAGHAQLQPVRVHSAEVFRVLWGVGR